MTKDYRLWNARLLDYCCENSVDRHGNIFLTVDAFLESQDEPDAETLFQTAVCEAFHPAFKSGYASRISSFLREDAEGRPLCAALLAATVLAAGDMGDNAYYEHLAKWLKCGEVDARKAFLNTSVILAWDELRDYFGSRGFTLLPPPRDGHRYVKRPLQHVLLRKIDIRKLARFFSEHNLSPLRRYTDKALQQCFSAWMLGNRLTSCGIAAWNDEVRQESVLQQIRAALESWDDEAYAARRKSGAFGREAVNGYHTPTGAAIAAAMLHSDAADAYRLDRIQNAPVHLAWERGDSNDAVVFFKLAPTNARLPCQFPFGGGVFRSRGGAGFYNAIPVDSPERAVVLQKGDEARMEGVRVRLQVNDERWEAGVFLFQNADDNGYAQTNFLQIGVPAAILVQKRYAEQVRAWLVSKGGSKEVPKKLKLHPCLADDWVLWTGFTPRQAAPAPPGLSALHIATDLSAQFRGGLRLDPHRNVWMEGAPPTVHFVGSPLPPEANVEGARIPVSIDGWLAPNALPSVPGECEVRAVSSTSQPVRRSLCIEAPRLHETRNDAALQRLFGAFHEPFQEIAFAAATPPPRPLAEPSPPSPPFPTDATPLADAVYACWHVLGARPHEFHAYAEPMTLGDVRRRVKEASFVAVWAMARTANDVWAYPLTTAPLPLSPAAGDASRLGCHAARAECAARLWLQAVENARAARGLNATQHAEWRRYQLYARQHRAASPPFAVNDYSQAYE